MGKADLTLRESGIERMFHADDKRQPGRLPALRTQVGPVGKNLSILWIRS
jgi:hypothetical protein